MRFVISIRDTYLPVLPLALSLGLAQQAGASSIVGSFTLNGGGLAKGASVNLCWDAQPQAGGTVSHDCFKINTTNQVGDSDIASQLAANINAKIGAGTATASGTEVQLSGYSASEPLKTNQYSYTTDEFYFAAGLSTSINFNPDLDTGSTMLTTPGSFLFTGPNSLDVSFSAVAGASDATLAQALSSLMNADGYSSTVVGSSVVFDTVAPGGISFTGSGNGVDVAFGGASATPEPAADFLAGCGLIALGTVHAVRRRRGRNPSLQ